jgi:hypothetical protein
METIKNIEREQIRMDLPDFVAGDTVTVHVKIREGNKERIQAFQGVVISRKKGLANATFTVRKVSYGVGWKGSSPRIPLLSTGWKSYPAVVFGGPRFTICGNCEERPPGSARGDSAKRVHGIRSLGIRKKSPMAWAIRSLQALMRPAGVPWPAPLFLPR